MTKAGLLGSNEGPFLVCPVLQLASNVIVMVVTEGFMLLLVTEGLIFNSY